MSNRQVLEWLNENELRCYPLTEGGNKQFLSTLSLNRCLLDASLVYTESSPATVNLQSFTVSGNSVTVVVTGQPAFVLEDKTGSYPAYCRNSAGSLLVFGAEMQHVTANVTFANIEFEPGCVIDLSGKLQGVTGFTTGSSNTVRDTVVAWQEGFQFGLRVEGQTIRMTANKNKGRPITCQNYFQNIANDCGAIISYINGVTPPVNPGVFLLKAGPHVQIFDDPDNHRIYIGLDFVGSDVCQPPMLPPALLT